MNLEASIVTPKRSVSGSSRSVYFAQGDYRLGFEYFQKYSIITRELGDVVGESIALYNLGCILFKMEYYSEAIEYLKKALEIFRKIDNNSEVKTLCKLAECHQALGNYKLALEYCGQGLEIATKLNLSLIQSCQELKASLQASET